MNNAVFQPILEISPKLESDDGLWRREVRFCIKEENLQAPLTSYNYYYRTETIGNRQNKRQNYMKSKLWPGRSRAIRNMRKSI